MASDEQKYRIELYKKRRKEAKETYKKRKEYLASKTLRKENVKVLNSDDTESESENKTKKENKGNAEEEPEGGIGNFSGDGELVVPAEHKQYRVTSPFKQRWGQMHWGIDLAPKVPGDRNTKILAAGDGVVMDARGGVGGFENWIVIKHNDKLYSIYGHMPLSSMKVKKGDKVKKGQHIALMGMEGQSTGVHLHFELCTNFATRRGNPSSTFDPATKINFQGGSSDGSGKKIKSKAIMQSIHMLEDDSDDFEYEQPMHALYENDGAPFTPEQKQLDAIYSSHYPYNPIKIVGNKIKISNYLSRKQFLITRIGWARTTSYKNFESLDKKLFIHQPHYDGYEGNIYSPDAKSIFESLLFKTKKPYFEIVSGFRFSNKGQLSPHEAGCAIDIHVKSMEEARELADCAWTIGIRSIAIGGDMDNKKGFVHLDVAPKGNDFSYSSIPIYGGPGKWEIG